MEVLKEIFLVFLLFFSYSTLGYLIEVIFCTLQEKKLVVNRGFLIGPYLPIYGVGAIAIIYLLDRYKSDVIALFVMGAVVCSIVEYLTSLIMEKIFKIRWWDYSQMKFNINGRICLSNSILFGLGGVLIVEVVNPFYVKILSSLSSFWVFLLGGFFSFIFFADFITTVVILIRLKLNSNMFMRKDATEEIKQKVYDALSKQTFLVSRVLRAFPKISIINDKKVKEFNDYIEKIRRERKLQKEKRRQ